MMDTVRAKVKTRGIDTSNDVKPWIKGFARFGYFAKGSVYILIGLLSIMAAADIGGSTSDSSGAFSSVASKPFGEVLLWIVGFGLIGYVCWRLIQTFMDPENKGTGAKELRTPRLSY
ncbi:DUF1206 domain-containing protein [Pseudalkalibacillus sp. A8]|uniref:DUF1206 domain-containing protein n=1 Tax=Pseudalkalibacillus sp. A8 TaxID=3382641 RepID=UPI0038B5BAD9